MGLLVEGLLRPGLHQAPGYVRRVADGLQVGLNSPSVMFPPIVSASTPLMATALPLFNLWVQARKMAR